MFAVVALAALLAGAATIARRVLGRRRMAAWDADWRLTEPGWVRRSELLRTFFVAPSSYL
jgi:hypothetical protein